MAPRGGGRVRERLLRLPIGEKEGGPEQKRLQAGLIFFEDASKPLVSLVVVSALEVERRETHVCRRGGLGVTQHGLEDSSRQGILASRHVILRERHRSVRRLRDL